MTYDYYDATQEQRRREREIRAMKREASANEAAGSTEKAKEVRSALRQKSAEYREFSEAMDISAKPNRLRVVEGLTAPNKSSNMNLQLFAEKDLKKQTIISLEKGINSLEDKIILHNDKIAHPDKYTNGWDDYSEKHKQGLINHWIKERDTFIESIQNRNEEIERRAKDGKNSDE